MFNGLFSLHSNDKKPAVKAIFGAGRKAICLNIKEKAHTRLCTAETPKSPFSC